MCKGNSISLLNCPFIVSICVLAVRVWNLIGRRTESDRTAYGIWLGGVRNRHRQRTRTMTKACIRRVILLEWNIHEYYQYSAKGSCGSSCLDFDNNLFWGLSSPKLTPSPINLIGWEALISTFCSNPFAKGRIVSLDVSGVAQVRLLVTCVKSA